MGRSKPESNAGELLASLDGTNRRKVAGVLLALAADLLADDVATPPAGETYHAERLPPGARSWRVVLDAHRSGELRASRVGRRLLVTGEDWAAYVASRKATPRRQRDPKPENLIDMFGERRGGAR